MRKVFIVYTVLVVILVYVSISAVNFRLDSVLVDGSERTYYGTVIDQAMAMTGYKRDSRGYLGLEFDDGDGICVWEQKMGERWQDVHIGDSVKVETAVEKRSGLVVALNVEVLSESLKE